MPKKATITKEMVVEAAFKIVREQGAECLNVRTVAKVLNCSTQPVMYHFEKIDDLKRAVYTKLDWYHTNYLMDVDKAEKGVSVRISLNYIRFAIKEPNLFRFLFQSGYAVESNLLEMIDAKALEPVILAMQEEEGMSLEQTKKAFITKALFAHGYASIIANNSLEYDESIIEEHLKRAYRGAVLAVKEETKC